MKSFVTPRRLTVATFRVAAATLAVGCAIALSGCVAAPDTAAKSLPSPTGTWTPPASDAPAGPQTAAPVPTQSASIRDDVEFSTGVSVSLSSVTAVTVTAKTPGEVSGPAVRVIVEVKNGTKEPLDMNSVVVVLTADKNGFGIGTTAGGATPFRGTVAPGASARGSYVFMLDPAKGRSVTVSVNYAAGDPVAIFTGKTA